MRQYILFLLFVVTALLISCKAESQHTNNSEYKELIKKAHQLVTEYHRGEKRVNKPVKVVYFHGSDQKPLPDFKARLTRTLNAVSDYYKEELSKFDVESEGIPFEKHLGNIVFHVVEGDHASMSYNKDSGYKIQKEIERKTKGKIDLSIDHVLVINGLCYQKEDGTYVFHSPFYGSGSEKNGICFAADCELLDSKYLTDTIQKMVFSEMFVTRKECLVAEFNSWYIGGIVHEMGHMFGLPHDFGNPSEVDWAHISMMGEYGSRHFKDYLWNGKISSSFSSASIFQLMSHPVFTRYDYSEDFKSKFKLTKLEFSKRENELFLNTNFQAKEAPYGAVALIRPSSLSEYLSHSFINLVSDSSSVGIEIEKLDKGYYNLSLLYLFSNGSTYWVNKHFAVDKKGNAVELKSPKKTTVDIKELYEQLKKEKQTDEVKMKLEIVEAILNQSAPIDLQTYKGDKLFLSDAKWEKAEVGWEKVSRNYYTCESESKFFLELLGELYKKGLYAHSPSSFVFDLDGKWTSFSATVGLRDNAHQQGSARFIIIGDGKVLYSSSALRVNQKEDINVDVSNVKILELKANGTEGHNHNSWAIWVNPELKR